MVGRKPSPRLPLPMLCSQLHIVLNLIKEVLWIFTWKLMRRTFSVHVLMQHACKFYVNLGSPHAFLNKNQAGTFIPRNWKLMNNYSVYTEPYINQLHDILLTWWIKLPIFRPWHVHGDHTSWMVWSCVHVGMFILENISICTSRHLLWGDFSSLPCIKVRDQCWIA